MSWLREPLLHFLALGAGLFLLHGAVAAPEQKESVIELGAGDIEQVVYIFEKTFQRPPTEAEYEGLVEERIRDEIYYRQALAMGLDQGDAVVRRRLRQKVEFLFDDLAGLVKPTEADLTEYLAAHADTYRRPSRVSFRHIYFDLSSRGSKEARSQAEKLLARLSGGEEVDIESAGDFLGLPRSYDSVAERDVSKQFGRRFDEQLAEVATGPWVGPLQSGFGLHLVQVSERQAGELPELAEVRQAVERDWSAERRTKSKAAYYEGLRKRYTVNVTRPELAQAIAEVKK